MPYLWWHTLIPHFCLCTISMLIFQNFPGSIPPHLKRGSRLRPLGPLPNPLFKNLPLWGTSKLSSVMKLDEVLHDVSRSSQKNMKEHQPVLLEQTKSLTVYVGMIGIWSRLPVNMPSWLTDELPLLRELALLCDILTSLSSLSSHIHAILLTVADTWPVFYLSKWRPLLGSFRVNVMRLRLFLPKRSKPPG